MGESGRGKSTFVQILQRFYLPESGTILVNGQNWNNWSMADWRSQLGVVPQSIKLFNGTVLDNIGLKDSSQSGEQIVAFCQEFGFAPFIENLPQGYLTPIGENGIQLSGGQQQVIALARALFRQPRLLLLDEPTAALDTDTERFFLNILGKCKNSMSILIITHKSELANRADRTYRLVNGQLLERSMAPQVG